MCECMNFGKLKDLVESFFIRVGPFLLLFDIMLDIYAIWSFYQEKEYKYLGILLLILVGSSVLVHIFSWLFYSYNNFESRLSQRQLKLLHVFQLGIFVRWYDSLRSATENFTVFDLEKIKQRLNNDLGVLRLIETFSESVPQLVLVLTIILQQGQLNWTEVLKAFGSASAIAVSLTMYHSYLRSFQPDKEKKQSWCSLAVFFFWNFLLISSRLTALALFASVLPRFIFIHFFCSWIVLFFVAWGSKTDLIQSPDGEWLFLATVSLIWYFKGRSKYLTLFYHEYILVDNLLLCSLWCWKMSTEPPSFKIPQLDAIITVDCVVSVYIIGLLCEKVYYKYYDQKPAKEESNGGPIGDEEHPEDVSDDDTTCLLRQHHNKKMRELAENFYNS